MSSKVEVEVCIAIVSLQAFSFLICLISYKYFNETTIKTEMYYENFFKMNYIKLDNCKKLAASYLKPT